MSNGEIAAGAQVSVQVVDDHRTVADLLVGELQQRAPGVLCSVVTAHPNRRLVDRAASAGAASMLATNGSCGYLQNLMFKLDAHSQHQLVAIAVREGITRVLPEE